jgi:hypothetical protein
MKSLEGVILSPIAFLIRVTNPLMDVVISSWQMTSKATRSSSARHQSLRSFDILIVVVMCTCVLGFRGADGIKSRYYLCGCIGAVWTLIQYQTDPS